MRAIRPNEWDCLINNLREHNVISLLYLLSAPEYKPKQADPATQVLWAVLCAGGGQKYSHSGDEQSPSSDHPHAR